jgi:hypothetical protein
MMERSSEFFIIELCGSARICGMCGECGAGPFSSKKILWETAGFGGKLVYDFSILFTNVPRYPHRGTDA